MLGVDDDTLLCEICSPPLSSIIPNIEQIGYEAAALLDRLMDGGSAEFEERFIPPLGIATRLSTDVLSVEDQEFAAAVRFIRENACHGITVRTSSIGSRCRGRPSSGGSACTWVARPSRDSPRPARSRQATARRDRPSDPPHRRAGGLRRHPEYFNVVFKREIGLTPGQYRQQPKKGSSQNAAK